jgi:isopentenyl phosphate kinase
MQVPKKIVLKVGGSVITRKDAADFPTSAEDIKAKADSFIRIDEIRRIAGEVREAFIQSGTAGMQLILVNGVGPFGHFLVAKGAPVRTVQQSTEILSDRVVVEFRKAGIDAVPMPPAQSVGYEEGKGFDVGFLWQTADLLLEEGKVPSVWGDQLEGGKVISGDDLAVMLAEKWKADMILMATDTKGVFESNPRVDAEAKLIRRMEAGRDHGAVFSLGRTDVTGGMGRKVERLLGAAKEGFPSHVFDGTRPGNVRNALLGDRSFGTVIVPSGA